MKKISETIVFFGSGPVAAASLARLAEDFNIEAVITKPKPPHHKGNFPVIDVAEHFKLPIQFVSNKADLSKLFKTTTFSSPLGIVIDFGIIIPSQIIKSFPKGIVNSHFSLLPRWRGADPISFAILSGDQQSGVSLMQVVEALDEGPLIAQSALNLSDSVTTPALTDELIDLSHTMLVQILPYYLQGSIAPQPQGSNAATYSRKLTKQDSELVFSKTADELEREVRAYLEWPRSRTKIGNTPVVVTKAHVVSGKGRPGELWRQDKSIGFYTNKDIFVIDSLIPAGKKKMSAEAFLAGYKTGN